MCIKNNILRKIPLYHSLDLYIITNFHCFKTDIDSILFVNAMCHQEADDIIVSCAARSASSFLYLLQ